jgi:hypothetical protein
MECPLIFHMDLGTSLNLFVTDCCLGSFLRLMAKPRHDRLYWLTRALTDYHLA